jgi:uncharacterized protein (TIGR02594 family)
MLEFSAFRRLLVALALCAASVAVSSSPALARSHHGVSRYVHARYSVHHMRYSFHHVRRHYASRRYRHVAHVARMPREVALTRLPHYRHATRIARVPRELAVARLRRFAHTHANVAPDTISGAAPMSGGGSSLVMEARRYLGGNPTSRGSLWCARFMNMVLEHTGHHGTGSDMASSFAHYGQRVSGPEVGAIAVMSRRGGGHVGIITGIDAHGNPIMISGNNGNRVREAPVSRGSIYAYVMPN